MSFIILFFAAVFSGSVYGAVCLNRKFGEMMPVTLFASVITVYVCGLAGFLKSGVYVAAAASAILYLLAAARMIKERAFKKYISNLITPASIFAVVVIAVFLYGTVGMRAFQWDEISHWASCVKRMYISNDFTSNPSIHAIFQSYPPAMAILQYSAMVIKGEFADWVIYLCYFVFSMALFMPFLEKLNIKHIAKNVALVCGLILIIISLNQEAFVTAYVDLFLSLMFAFLIAYLFCFDCEKDKLCNITLALAAAITVLTKDAGMLFAAFMSIGFVLSCIAEKGVRNINIRSAENYLWFSPLAAALAAKLSWKINLIADKSVVRFDGEYNFAEFIGILAGKDGGYRSDVLKKFCDVFFSSVPSESVFTIDYNFLIMAAFAALAAVVAFANRTDCKDNRKRKIIFASTVVTAAVYVGGMLASYMYKFSEYEALKLASVDRYMSILLTAAAVAAMLIFITLVAKNNSGNTKIYILAAVYLMFSLVNTNYVKQLTQRVFINRSIEQTQKYEAVTAKVQSLNIGDKKIAVTAQGDDGYIGLMYAYTVYPANVDSSVGYDPVGSGQTAQEYIDSLVDNGYDYLILYNFDDEFAELCAPLMADGSAMVKEGIYRVDHQSKTLVFTA